MTMLALIHGFLGRPDDWAEIRRRIAQPTVAPRIPVAADWNSGVALMASQLPDPCVAVGYSMGARIALACALSDPRRFRALVLVSGNPGLRDDQRDARWTHDQQICTKLLDLPLDEFLRQWYRQAIFSSLTHAQAESLVHDKRALDVKHFSAILACYSIAKQPNFWGRLGELPMPVVVVAGHQDLKYVEIARQMARRLSNGRLRLVPRAGHIVHRERPEQFIEILNELVTDLSKENTLP